MLLLDTSFLVFYEAELVANRIGPARGILRSRPREPVAISIVSMAEFAEGFENFHDVESFLSRFRIIGLSRSIAYKAAAMQSRLPQRLGENDAWIAATAFFSCSSFEIYSDLILVIGWLLSECPHLSVKSLPSFC